MADTYVGLIVLEIDGTEYEVVSLSTTENTNRKVVKTMNSSGRPLGTSKGVADYSLTVNVAIPKTGEPNWSTLIDGKITAYPQDGGGLRETWTGVHLVTKGSTYNLDNEATRELQLSALNYYTE
ncbi:hypothetical protein L2Y94_06640 [Luteibacter aegosomatis]|uniref:hypothetical protein n=1 Tax=Luteibacter aegosomatis TaxID=2911537 RepID=UPI001FF97345|nr:hypothetical protein [Luteibacter aegosomatis]UPG87029.1 hypothetical protein L2Y94_06640 [Luteibacter aegosomatis]